MISTFQELIKMVMPQKLPYIETLDIQAINPKIEKGSFNFWQETSFGLVLATGSCLTNKDNLKSFLPSYLGYLVKVSKTMEIPDPIELLTRLNNHLYKNQLSCDSISISVACWDSSSDILNVVSFGQSKAYIIDSKFSILNKIDGSSELNPGTLLTSIVQQVPLESESVVVLSPNNLDDKVIGNSELIEPLHELTDVLARSLDAGITIQKVITL